MHSFRFIPVIILSVCSSITNAAFNCSAILQCFCTETLVACSHANLIEFPMISGYTTILKLQNNQIEKLVQSDFSHLPLLQTLDLGHNKIRLLKSLGFSGLASLEILWLNHNQITTIEKRAFVNLNELQELNLSHNPIHNVDSKIFLGVPNLQQIFLLSDCVPFTCERLQRSWNLANQFCSENSLIVPKMGNPVECHLIDNDIFSMGTKSPNDSSPIFTETPEDYVRMKPNIRLELICDASGHPKPEIRWKVKNNVLSKDRKLIINDLSYDMEVECVAQNRAGMASKMIHILVLGTQMLNPEISNLINAEFIRNSSRQVDWSNNMTGFMDLYKSLMRVSDSGYDFGLKNSPVETDWIVPGVDMIVSNFTGCLGGSQPHVLDCESHGKYRTISGYCNNLERPDWGSAPIRYRRILPAKYEDNFAKPLGWFKDRLYNGFPKPSARRVSKQLLSTKSIYLDTRHSHMLMQFGQFLDHDLTFAGLTRRWSFAEGLNVDCRTECGINVEPCYSIQRENMHKNAFDRCIEVIRSTEACGTGYSSPIVGKLHAREQANTLTSFIDGSQIYGSNSDFARYLRKETSGLLEISQIGNATFLPIADDRYPMDCQLKPHSWFQLCFVTGDHRANEQIGLLVMHNLFLREHNRLALSFQKLHPKWDDEMLYQQARRIVGAQLQKITYEEWLPPVIGSEGMKMLGEYSGYNSSVDPTLANVFAAVGMRFGHTLISPKLIQKRIRGQVARLKNLFFAPDLLFQPEVTQFVMTGLMDTPLKAADPRAAISSELTDHLFSKSRVRALDLAAINIQRGRDHGIPEYNNWRVFCGLKRAKSFNDLIEIRNSTIRSKLEELYGHVDNIDPWVGAVLENVVAHDAKVGPTFRCLLVEQFRRLRDGDRYFYKNPQSFSSSEQKELTKSSLSKILCDNESGIKSISRNAFSYRQSKVNCSQLQGMDLNLFE